MLRNGVGGPKDPESARNRFRKSCGDQKDVEIRACIEEAIMAQKGEGGRRDEELSLAVVDKHCANPGIHKGYLERACEELRNAVSK